MLLLVAGFVLPTMRTPMIDEEQRRRHARRSLKLAVVTLAIFAILTIIVPLAASALNGYSFLRFPLGLFLATQGTVLGIIAATYWSAARQDRLDRRHGLTSEF
jgi:putative solute:sodium symporter small subunit